MLFLHLEVHIYKIKTSLYMNGSEWGSALEQAELLFPFYLLLIMELYTILNNGNYPPPLIFHTKNREEGVYFASFQACPRKACMTKSENIVLTF